MPPKKLGKNQKAAMKTTAKPRRSASRGRLKEAPLQAGGGSSTVLKKQGTVSKDARSKTPVDKRTTRRNTKTNARRTTATTTKRKRFQPPPRPPMYWICYDFSMKLGRGLCLGIAVGLLLTVVLPWIIDSGYFVYDTITETEYKWPDVSSYTNISSWNVTSPRLWRPDQESQQKNGNLRGQTIPEPTQDPKVVADQRLHQNFRRFNRTMTVVHVGHTGGWSLIEASPTLLCKEKQKQANTDLQACLQEHAALSNTPLAREAKYYLQKGSGRPEELQQSTSFLFTLRNPVDRMLAIYHDSHPSACSTGISPEPWGCTTQKSLDMPDTPPYIFYHDCFPNPSPEQFGQAVKSPWVNITGEEKLVTTLEQQQSDCRWMSRELVAGGSRDMIQLAPHAYYNYKKYAQQSVWKFDGGLRGNGPEVLAIRAEYESQDLALLHRLLGGDPQTALPPVTKTVTTPSVTPQAYGKLCCVLEDEIEIYETLLKGAANLPEYEKQQSMDDLRQKCGLTETMGWDDWRVQCKNQMEIDTVLLTP